VADALTELGDFIRLGRTDADGKAKELLGALLGRWPPAGPQLPNAVPRALLTALRRVAWAYSSP